MNIVHTFILALAFDAPGLKLVSMIDTNYYLNQVFNGLVVGMIFVLIALGLTLIFGMMGIVNFAHGDLLLVGTYVGYSVMTATKQIWIALILAPIVVGGIGALIERFALRYTYDKNPLLQLLLTFSLAEILRASVQIIWGSTRKSVPNPVWAKQSINLVLFGYPLYRLFVIAVTLLLIVVLYLFISRTDTGMIIRAGTYDREMVDVLGINVTQVYLLVFVLGCVLAGFAGALIAPIRGAYPTLGINLLIPSFVVVIIGGLGSFKGTIISGLLVGELMVLTGFINSSWSNVVIYLFMAIVLLLRPRGLFGQEGVFS